MGFRVEVVHCERTLGVSWSISSPAGVGLVLRYERRSWPMLPPTSTSNGPVPSCPSVNSSRAV